MEAAVQSRERLFSLDLLRGLDMFLLCAVGPVVGACHQVWGLPDVVWRQFYHTWGTFGLWDIIMPLFIFMCGAAVPLALPRRMEDGRAGRRYWGHVASRVALLWVLGLVAQGNLLTLDGARITLFDNTLQAIAVGYAVAALAQAYCTPRVRRWLPFVLTVAYAIPLALGGDYTESGNFAYRAEEWIVSVLPFLGVREDRFYTWYLTSLMFGAMTLFGAQATAILRSPRTPRDKAARLAGYGAALLAAGWALVPVVPSVKHIYTASFTLQAVGWSMLAYAALFVLTDIWKLRRGLGVFLLYGQCALFVYMCTETVLWGAFVALAKALTFGLPHLFGGERYMPLVVNAVAVAAVAVVTHHYRKSKCTR